MTYERYALAALGIVALGAAGCASSDAAQGAGDAGTGGNSAGGGAGGSAAGSSATGGSAAGGKAAGGNGGAAAGGAGAGTGGAGQAGSDASVGGSSGSSCAGHSYAFCEDFESANDGELPAGWTKVDGWNQGDALVTSSEHHGGQRALASAVAVNGQPRAGHSLTSLGATAGTHWGRIFYKVKTPPPLPNGGGVIHNTMVGLRGSSESRVVDTVVNSSGDHQFLYNLPDDSCCTGSAYDYHSYDGAWHCAEWYIDANTQSFRFFFEGTEVTSVGFDNRPGGEARIEQFSSIAVGWINYQSPDPPYYEAWFDDLAIDETRIGCN
jgi:hypothetical protein